MFGYKEAYKIRELDTWFDDEKLISESIELGYTVDVFRNYVGTWQKHSEITLE